MQFHHRTPVPGIPKHQVSPTNTQTPSEAAYRSMQDDGPSSVHPSAISVEVSDVAVTIHCRPSQGLAITAVSYPNS